MISKSNQKQEWRSQSDHRTEKALMHLQECSKSGCPSLTLLQSREDILTSSFLDNISRLPRLWMSQWCTCTVELAGRWVRKTTVSWCCWWKRWGHPDPKGHPIACSRWRAPRHAGRGMSMTFGWSCKAFLNLHLLKPNNFQAILSSVNRVPGETIFCHVRSWHCLGY